MMFDATTGNTSFHGPDLPELSLQCVLNFKYLGVQISCSPYNMFRCFNDQVKKKARCYLASVLSLVKSGPDRASLAHALWTSCALPSILYGAEVLPLTQETISEVERCQAAVGKFMLQISRSSANVASHLDAGMKPIWARVSEKVMLYAYKVMGKPSSYWGKLAYDENIAMGAKSAYTRYLLKWKSATNCFGLHPKQIRATVNSAAISSILQEQTTVCSTTFAMNSPSQSNINSWFKPKRWVNDSYSSKIIAEFRACNSNLGNRGPARDGNFYKLCPLCSSSGKTALNNEVSHQS